MTSSERDQAAALRLRAETAERERDALRDWLESEILPFVLDNPAAPSAYLSAEAGRELLQLLGRTTDAT